VGSWRHTYYSARNNLVVVKTVWTYCKRYSKDHNYPVFGRRNVTNSSLVSGSFSCFVGDTDYTLKGRSARATLCVYNFRAIFVQREMTSVVFRCGNSLFQSVGARARRFVLLHQLPMKTVALSFLLRPGERTSELMVRKFVTCLF